MQLKSLSSDVPVIEAVSHFTQFPAIIPAFSNPEFTENPPLAFVTVQSTESSAVQEVLSAAVHSVSTPTTLSVDQAINLRDGHGAVALKRTWVTKKVIFRIIARSMYSTFYAIQTGWKSH